MIRAENWRLILDGEVERPVQIDYRSLRNLPAVEVTKTLECISNFVTLCDMVPFGGDLTGNARWKGARTSTRQLYRSRRRWTRRRCSFTR